MEPNRLLSVDQIIKPGQVPNLNFFTPQQKMQVQQKVATLWEKMRTLPNDDPEHMQAHRALSEMSHQFKSRLTQFKNAQAQAQAQQQAAAAQPSMAQVHAQAQLQQQQQQMAAQIQAQQANAAAQRTPQFSEKVRQEVLKFNPAIPQELRTRPIDEQNRWKQTQVTQYANLMRHWEAASHAYEEFRKRATDSRPTMTPDDIEKAKEEMGKLKIALDAAQKAAMSFRITHDPAAAAGYQRTQATRAAQQQAAQRQAIATAAAQQQAGNRQIPKIEEKGDYQTQVKSEDTDNDVNKIQQAPSSQNPQNTPSSQPAGAQQSIRPPPVSMQTAPTQSSVPPGQPTPLTHPAAIERAQRSHSQSIIPQQTQSGSTANQAITRETSTPSTSAMNNGGKLTTPNRPLNISPLTPATMPASRPTLTGGQGPLGPEGQVALPKMPNYVLPVEGEGRLLSRSKLLELAREVTGGAVGDGSDVLDPDVEEILLDVADEFVDNVITAACQLAKIRGSNTLELRDVQLVIERNYNIRVPGFASDELRTVKRILPTPSWTQKMSAVQAAKVTGGKGDA